MPDNKLIATDEQELFDENLSSNQQELFDDQEQFSNPQVNFNQQINEDPRDRLLDKYSPKQLRQETVTVNKAESVQNKTAPVQETQIQSLENQTVLDGFNAIPQEKESLPTLNENSDTWHGLTQLPILTKTDIYNLPIFLANEPNYSFTFHYGPKTITYQEQILPTKTKPVTVKTVANDNNIVTQSKKQLVQAISDTESEKEPTQTTQTTTTTTTDWLATSFLKTNIINKKAFAANWWVNAITWAIYTISMFLFVIGCIGYFQQSVFYNIYLVENLNAFWTMAGGAIAFGTSTSIIVIENSILTSIAVKQHNTYLFKTLGKLIWQDLIPFYGLYPLWYAYNRVQKIDQSNAKWHHLNQNYATDHGLKTLLSGRSYTI